jgi:hypothetical protein
MRLPVYWYRCWRNFTIANINGAGYPELEKDIKTISQEAEGRGIIMEGKA